AVTAASLRAPGAAGWFVRAAEKHAEDVALVPNENRLRLVIDVDRVGRRHRVLPFGAGVLARDDADREGAKIAACDDARGHRRERAAALSQKIAPGSSVIRHWA